MIGTNRSFWYLFPAGYEVAKNISRGIAMSVIYYNLNRACTLENAVSKLSYSNATGDLEWSEAINPFPSDRNVIYVILNLNENSSNSYVGIAGNLANRFKTRCEAAVHLGLDHSYMKNIHVWWGTARVFNTPATSSTSRKSTSPYRSAPLSAPHGPVPFIAPYSTAHSVSSTRSASGSSVAARAAAQIIHPPVPHRWPRPDHIPNPVPPYPGCPTVTLKKPPAPSVTLRTANQILHHSLSTDSSSSTSIRSADAMIVPPNIHASASAVSSRGSVAQTSVATPVSSHALPPCVVQADCGLESQVSHNPMIARIDDYLINLEQLLIRYYLNTDVVDENTNTIFARNTIFNATSSPIKIYVDYCRSGSITSGTGSAEIQAGGNF